MNLSWKGFFSAARKPLSLLMTIAILFLILALDGIMGFISDYKICYASRAFGLLSGGIVGMIVLTPKNARNWEKILKKVLHIIYCVTFSTMFIIHFIFLLDKNTGSIGRRNFGLPEPCWNCWKSKLNETYNQTIPYPSDCV